MDEIEKLKAKNKAYEDLLREIYDNLWCEGLSSIDMINICEKIKAVLKEKG